MRGVPASHRPAARHHGARARQHRLGARPLHRRRAAAVADGGAVAGAGAGVRRRHLRRRADHADRLPARRGPGRVLHRGAVARRRLGGAHQRGDQAGRGRPEEDARRQSRAVDHRLLAARRRQRTELGLHGGAHEAVRRPQGGRRIRCRRRSGKPSAPVRRSGRPMVLPFNLPPIIGLSTSGGFEYQLDALEGQDPGRARQRDGRPDRRGQPRSPADAGVLDLHGDQSVDLSRHRPRQGAGARPQHERRVHRAAGHARRHLCQQLQSVRPHLAGQRQGEAANRGDIPDIWQIYVRNSTGADGADALDRHRCGS